MKQLLPTWNRLNRIPGGRLLFSRLLGQWVPYTGSVRPEVLELAPGYSKLALSDRRAVRNHLQSIHAAALMNFAEAASGLAFVTGLPDNCRAIVTKFTIEYTKKARGRLTAECHAPRPPNTESRDYEVDVELKDESNAVVARAKAHWRVGAAGR